MGRPWQFYNGWIFTWLNPRNQKPAWIFSTAITLTTKSLPLPEFLNQNFTWKELKYILKRLWWLFYVFSPLRISFLPEEMQLWTGRCRSQTPAHWARLFRYLGCNPNRYSEFGFRRLRHPALSKLHEGGRHEAGSIGVAAKCQPKIPVHRFLT